MANQKQVPGITEGESSRPNPFTQLERDPLTNEWVIKGLPTGGDSGAPGGAPLLKSTNPVIPNDGMGMVDKGMNFGKMFGKGLDPTSLLLAGLSLFGGDDGGQERDSFVNPGSIADPRQALYQALSGVYRMGQGLSQRGPARLRSVVAKGPEPVSIPGLGFQIGGGLGTDPALSDPSMLEGRGNGTQFDPFQSIATQQMNGDPMAGNPNPRKK